MCSQQVIGDVGNPNLIDDAGNQSEMVDVLNIDFCGLVLWRSRKTLLRKRSYLFWANLGGEGKLSKPLL
jgi:hypothetical protein